MGTLICKALDKMQGPGFKTVREGEGFSADISFFTRRDGSVVIPRHVLVVSGDNLPANAVILTKTSNKRMREQRRATPSELMGRVAEPGQMFTIDTQGEQYSPAGLANELASNMLGEATGEDLGLPLPPVAEPLGGDSAVPPTGEAKAPASFDRSAAFQRLLTLTGKNVPGNTSNANLQALLEKAEAAVMGGN